jgi:putative hydrolase of the HAD superfamily
VGGVLLTNGWDRHSRRHCVESFGLDYEEFRDRHEFVADAFETGRMSIDDYLDRTVFYRDREFTREAFLQGMMAESQPFPDALMVVEELTGSGRYLLATLNNESKELNQARIDTFGLRRHFTAFFSSGFLGVKKPDQAIYRLALHLTQRDPAECVFIDDRDLNLECAIREGMNAIHYRDPGQLRSELAGIGIDIKE